MPVNYFGYLLESIVCSPSVKNHLTLNVKGDYDAMERTALTLLDTLVQPADRDLVRAARGLPSEPFQFFCQTDLSPQEIKASIPRYWLSLFALSPPEVRLGRYLTRLVNELRCELECFIMALCVLRRVAARGFPICSRSIHRVFFTTCVIVAKTRDDKYYPMSFYARIGGVRKEDIEAMEVSLLNVISFDAGVTTFEFVDMLYALRVHCASLAFGQGQEWAQKGWEEIVANVRYPARHHLQREIGSLKSSITFPITFTNDLPMSLRQLQQQSSQLEESMASLPHDNPIHSANPQQQQQMLAAMGAYRPVLHDTPFSSISQLPQSSAPDTSMSGPHPVYTQQQQRQLPTMMSADTSLSSAAMLQQVNINRQGGAMYVNGQYQHHQQMQMQHHQQQQHQQHHQMQMNNQQQQQQHSNQHSNQQSLYSSNNNGYNINNVMGSSSQQNMGGQHHHHHHQQQQMPQHVPQQQQYTATNTNGLSGLSSNSSPSETNALNNTNAAASSSGVGVVGGELASNTNGSTPSQQVRMKIKAGGGGGNGVAANDHGGGGGGVGSNASSLSIGATPLPPPTSSSSTNKGHSAEDSIAGLASPYGIGLCGQGVPTETPNASVVDRVALMALADGGRMLFAGGVGENGDDGAPPHNTTAIDVPPIATSAE